MKIKKILSIILAGTMVMALLTSCGSSKNSQSSSSNNQSSASTEAPNETTENAAESTTGSVEANIAENATEADTLAGKIRDRFPGADVEVIELCSPVAAHTGLGSICLQYFRKK